MLITILLIIWLLGFIRTWNFGKGFGFIGAIIWPLALLVLVWFICIGGFNDGP